jgi:hypothetical protein
LMSHISRVGQAVVCTDLLEGRSPKLLRRPRLVKVPDMNNFLVQVARQDLVSVPEPRLHRRGTLKRRREGREKETDLRGKGRDGGGFGTTGESEKSERGSRGERF